MFACLTTVISTGAGTSSVVHFTDGTTGVPFVPTAFAMMGDAGVGVFSVRFGCSNGIEWPGGSVRRSAATEDVFAFGTTKLVDGCGSDAYSLISEQADASFGGIIALTGYIDTLTSGSYTIHWITNVRAGTAYLILVFGGADLEVQAGPFDLVSGSYDTPFAPAALLCLPGLNSGTSTGTGGRNMGISWAAQHGLTSTYGTMSINVVSQGNNYRYQQDDGFASEVDATGALIQSRTIGAWKLDGVDLVPSASTLDQKVIAFGPSGTIIGASGTQAMRATTGAMTISTGIKPRIILFASVGNQNSATVRASLSQLCFGAFDDIGQSAYWTAEDQVGNGAIQGSASINGTHVLAFCDNPNLGSSAFTATVAATNIDTTTGDVTLNVDLADGVARDILWFAIGEVLVPPTPPPTGTERPVRVVRRFPLPFSENKWIKVNNFQVVMQSGVGLSTGQGSDPQAMVRFSKDGGATWGNETWVPMGQIGEYLRRARITRGPRGRNLVCEIACSEPVFVGFIQALADLDEGAS